MRKEQFSIGKKQLKVPIIQGGMGVGISLGGLAGAVAKEGGAGTISAAQIGFREPDFYENPVEANKRAIHKEMDKARKISPEGVIGFNLMVAMNDYETYVREVIAAGADFIVSGAGLPVDLPAYIKDSDIAIAPIVSTRKSAHVILKFWDKKYKKTADFIVIEGPMAGGHLGFHKEQIGELTPEIYAEEVKEIIAVVRKYEEKYEKKIPVILAGGIYEHADYERAFTLGADGVQIATRFVTTEECDADEHYKQSYIQAKKEDIVIVNSPVGMPGRAIRNVFLDKVKAEGRIPPTKCLRCIHTCNPAETPYCITEALIHAAKGEVDQALLFCGGRAYEAKTIETVKKVIDYFCKDCL